MAHEVKSRLEWADMKEMAPEANEAMLALGKTASVHGLDKPLQELVKIRVSQINGCPYCVDLHWRDARAEGEDERKLNGVVLWRDMPFFSQRERAALAWAEAVTRLRDQHVSDEEFAEAHKVFNDKEIVDLTMAIANMNAMNRVAIAFHAVPHLPRQTEVEV